MYSVVRNRMEDGRKKKEINGIRGKEMVNGVRWKEMANGMREKKMNSAGTMVLSFKVFYLKVMKGI